MTYLKLLPGDAEPLRQALRQHHRLNGSEHPDSRRLVDLQRRLEELLAEPEPAEKVAGMKDVGKGF